MWLPKSAALKQNGDAPESEQSDIWENLLKVLRAFYLLSLHLSGAVHALGSRRWTALQDEQHPLRDDDKEESSKMKRIP